MTATVTERAARGGSRFLAVQAGRRILLTFPLSTEGRALAQDMALEANYADESQYPAIVARYSAKKADLPEKAGDPASKQHASSRERTPAAVTDFADLSSHPRAVKPIPAMISAKEPELLPKPRPTTNGVAESVAAAAKSMESLGVALAANADDVKLSQLLQAALSASRKASNDQQIAEVSRRAAVSSWQKYREALESAGIDPTILAEAEAEAHS